MKIIFVLIIIIATVLEPVSVIAASPLRWELVFQPRQRQVQSIATFKNQIFIGTANGIQISKDGNSWADLKTNQLQKDSNGNSQINWIYTDQDTQNIFIATSFGAYFSKPGSIKWEKLFENTKIESNTVNSLFVEDSVAYLSTNDGLWVCNLSEDTCRRLNEGLQPTNETGNQEIFYTAKYGNYLFLTSASGIYSFDYNTYSWRNIAGLIKKLPNGNINARHLLMDKEGRLWAACGTGIYVTADDGNTWHNKSNGIKKNKDGFQELFYLFESKNNFYAATASGVYLYNKKNGFWDDISSGIRTVNGNKNVYWLTEYKNKLYSATDEGLFAIRTSSFVSQKTKQDVMVDDKENAKDEEIVLKGKIESEFTNLEELEPQLVEVQKQALQFASLPTASDYKRYRVQARLRNFIPRVGFDINSANSDVNLYEFQKEITTDISLSNRFNSDSLNRLQRDGKSFKQLSVQWNANQLLYDDEIREILNQARLTANIRENILDDVTKLYFQRRKLQLEALTSLNMDFRKRLNHELQIAELTGQLDSRTGGWFSKELERKKRK